MKKEMQAMDAEIKRKEKKLKKAVHKADSIRKGILGKTNELDLSIKKLKTCRQKVHSVFLLSQKKFQLL